MLKKFVSKSEADTIKFGNNLGKVLRGGEILALCGELGSGKTSLVKGIAKGLGVKSNRHVNSPSFVILKEYEGRVPLYHFDIYRLDEAADFLTVDYAEYFYDKGVSVIEWADKIIDLLPKEFLRIDITMKENKNERAIKIAPHGKRYMELLKKLNQTANIKDVVSSGPIFKVAKRHLKFDF
jgi:tRNA threonylcarbamoyladenosine biosynthesis protein TsaE